MTSSNQDEQRGLFGLRHHKRPGYIERNMIISLGVLAALGLGIATVKHLVLGPSPWYSWLLAPLVPPGLLILGWWVADLQEKQPSVRLPEFDDENWGAGNSTTNDAKRTIIRSYDTSRPTCPQCGAGFFRAAPDCADCDEVRHFSEKTNLFKDNPHAAEGVLHPGYYCPNGCTAVLAHSYSLEGGLPYGDYRLCLLDAGSRRAEVADYIRRITGASEKETLSVLDHPCLEIKRGGREDMERSRQDMEALGAAVRVEPTA